MLQGQNYAALLRPIGQMLEALRIESFAVRPDPVGFVVGDRTRNRAQLTPRERTFLAQLHSGHSASLDKQDALRLAAGVFEWHVTEGDLARFEREGRQRRRDGHQAPDAQSVSQLLRVIGTILDHKRAQSFDVSKDDRIVTIEYEVFGGRKFTEQFNLPTLYDFWVGMYKKRMISDNSARPIA
jgi:hypothetical protein